MLLITLLLVASEIFHISTHISVITRVYPPTYQFLKNSVWYFAWDMISPILVILYLGYLSTQYMFNIGVVSFLIVRVIFANIYFSQNQHSLELIQIKSNILPDMNLMASISVLLLLLTLPLVVNLTLFHTVAHLYFVTT
jgi:hypothetical protein